MGKREAFDLCNSIIKDLNGKPLNLNSPLKEACLDDLGLLLLFVGLRNKYKNLKNILPSQTIKQIINMCVLAHE